MFSRQDIIKEALRTIELEEAAIASLKNSINDSFCAAAEAIYQSKGRVVITGIGKSAIIAQKAVATFNSTGTPSLFMHAADAIHGDLGMIQQDDIVIIISKSGESPEIKLLVPLVKNFGNKVIALCGSKSSYLATQADFFIDTTVDTEACPHNLAPTCSTTAQLAMSDALAVCLLHMKGFTSDDFARFHPGGALGKRLYLRVGDLSSHNPKPEVQPGTGIREVIYEISAKRLGATVVTEGGKITGIITDGDIRRMLQKNENPWGLVAKDICSSSPKTVEETELAVSAMELMRKHDITQVVVVKEGSYSGIIHLHDLLREGII
jgi:arabinose-5-phosphate isomerase